MNLKPSTILAAALWLTFLALAWLLALGVVPADGPRGAVLFTVLLAAVGVGAYVSGGKKR